MVEGRKSNKDEVVLHIITPYHADVLYTLQPVKAGQIKSHASSYEQDAQVKLLHHNLPVIGRRTLLRNTLVEILPALFDYRFEAIETTRSRLILKTFRHDFLE